MSRYLCRQALMLPLLFHCCFIYLSAMAHYCVIRAPCLRCFLPSRLILLRLLRLLPPPGTFGLPGECHYLPPRLSLLVMSRLRFFAAFAAVTLLQSLRHGSIGAELFRYIASIIAISPLPITRYCSRQPGYAITLGLSPYCQPPTIQ